MYRFIRACLYISCLMLFLAFSAVAGVNLVPNPAFEEGPESADAPSGWEYRQNFVSPAALGEAYGRWEEDGFVGGRSISITEERWFSASQWSCTVEGIEPGRYYLFSLRAKRDTGTGWVPKLRLFEQSRIVNIKRPGEYRYFEFLLHSGDIEGSSELALIVYRKPSMIWFDDLRLVKLSLEALEPVYDDAGTYFSWRLPENGQALNYAVELYAGEGSQVPVYTREGIEEAFYRGPVLPPGSYRWRVMAYSGVVLLAESGPFPFEVEEEKGERDDILYEAGEGGFTSDYEDSRAVIERLREAEEFPVGIFNLLPGEAVEAAQAGVNWAVSHRDAEPYLEAGMRIVGPVSQPEPDIFYLYDEPEQHGVLPADVRRRHSEARSAAPDVPTAITIYDPDRYMEYAGASDILMVDPYPVPVRPLASVAEAVVSARKVRRDKPVWAVIQAFSWDECSPEAAREGIGRLPTREELNAMTYLAIAAGAEGILFYTVGSRSRYHAEVMEMLKELSRELKGRQEFLLSSGGEVIIEPPFYILEKDVPDRGLYRLVVNSGPSERMLGDELVEGYGVRLERIYREGQ